MAVRAVTIVFTDLVGSTEERVRVGEERAEQVRRAVFAAQRDAVASHRGTEVKTEGDGLMVVFDSATDALLGALAMQRGVARVGERQALDLGLRVGVGHGEATEERGDWFGLPVVVAARLCATATAGQVLATDLVRSVVGSRGSAFCFDAVGPLDLKGVGVPVDSVAVRAAPAPPASLPPALDPAGRTPFVGRAEELPRLREECARGSGFRLVLISGEPGIGKTRLAAELASEFEGTVRYGRSDEDGVIAYQPFVEALRGDRSPFDRPRPEASVVADGAFEQIAGIAQDDRFRLFEEVVEELVDLAPALLVVDDLHWADRSTLQLIRHLLRSPEPGPVVIIATYRDTELGRTHPLSALLADLRRDKPPPRIDLQGLGEADVGELVASWSEGKAPEALAQTVHSETEGNPFFVEEVLRELADAGWEGDPARADIPQGVREAVSRRLSRLSPAANEALTVASVVGRDFSTVVVAEVLGISADKVTEAMESALVAGLVAEVPGAVDRWSFSHALVKETLQRELSASRRVRLHRRVGEAIESVHIDDLEPHLAALARHFAEAGDVGGREKAVDYSRRAASQAERASADEEAMQLYRLALAALEPGDLRRAELLIDLARAMRLAGYGEEADRTAVDARDAARRAGDPVLLARASLVGSFVTVWEADIDPAAGASRKGAIDEALSALGPDETPPERLRSGLRARLIAERAGFGDREERVEGTRVAVEVARRSGSPSALLLALNLHRAQLALAPGSVDEIVRVSQEAQALAALVPAARLIDMPLLDQFELGDGARFDAALDDWERLVSSAHSPVLGQLSRGYRVLQALRDGRWAAAEVAAREVLRVGARFGTVMWWQVYGAFVFALRREQGRLAEIEAGTRAYAREVRAPVYACVLAVIDAELGLIDRARDAANELSADGFAELSRDAFWQADMCFLAEVAWMTGNVALAEMLRHELAGFRHRNIKFATFISLGAGDRYLALAEAVIGRLDDAVAHLDAAIEYNQRWRSPPQVAHCQHDLAAVLLRRRAIGDVDRATSLLDAARATAEDLDMVRLNQKIEETLAG